MPVHASGAEDALVAVGGLAPLVFNRLPRLRRKGQEKLKNRCGMCGGADHEPNAICVGRHS